MKSLFQLPKIEVSWALGDSNPYTRYSVPTRFLAPVAASKIGPLECVNRPENPRFFTHGESMLCVRSWVPTRTVV